MVSRTKERTAVLRSHLPWRAYDRVLNRKCLHVDGWLYQTGDDTLYFVFRTSAGGIHELARTAYRAEPGGLVPVEYSERYERDGVARQVDSPWARRNAPWLNELHWRHVLPSLRGDLPEPFKGHRSILLHYVWSDPKLTDPWEGLDNLYAASARRERDDRQAGDRPAIAPAPQVPAPWDARERSVLRTIDKLLK